MYQVDTVFHNHVTLHMCNRNRHVELLISRLNITIALEVQRFTAGIKVIVLLHKDFSPSSEQPEQRLLTHQL